MKTIIVQGDGIAGLPSQALDGKTPLQIAKTNTLDFLACHGEFGDLKFLNEQLSLTGDLIHLSLMGYDPQKYYSGPGSLVSAGLEVFLGPQDVAFLCSFITVGLLSGSADIKKLGTQVYLQDDTASSIETEDARELINAINEQLGSEEIQFFAGAGHRHLMVWVSGLSRMICYDPHFVLGKDLGAFLPSGEGADVLKELMEASRIILRNHPLNRERENMGLNPANCFWLWGPGKPITLPKFKDRFGISGATISNSELHQGIGRCAGWETINIDATFDFNKNIHEKYVEATLRLIQQFPMVYLHTQEQPDCAETYLNEKIERVEKFDQELLGSLLQRLPDIGDFQVLVVCNHWDGENEGSGKIYPTPFVFYKSCSPQEKIEKCQFNEVEAGRLKGGERIATQFMERLLLKS